MTILYLFEKIRNPILDFIMASITHLGSEMFLIVASLIVLWCINKKWGYYLLFISSFGTTINQFLKNYFMIARPWLKDPNLTVVEAAKDHATGYSFPSGHTQTIAGFFGGLIKLDISKFVKVVAYITIFLVAISRMYLGVHTLEDVALSLLIAAFLVLIIHPLFFKKNNIVTIMSVGVLFAIAFVIYMELKLTRLSMINELDLDGIKNAYTCLGLALAIVLAYKIDEKYLNYPVKAVWWAQIIKCVVGLAIMLGIRMFLKEPLYLLTNYHYSADMIRYFIMAMVGGSVWPMTFKWFEKLK